MARPTGWLHRATAWSLVGLVVVAGCTRTYYVRPEHLERGGVAAAAGGEVAIPALDSRREPTFLRMETFRRISGRDRSGLLEVSAADPRTVLRVFGWVAGVQAALYCTAALAIEADPHPSADDRAAKGPLLAWGVLNVVAALPLLILGYAIDGAEADAATPGFAEPAGSATAP